MIKYFLLIFFIITNFLSAENKYYIFFKDKGKDVLSKTSEEYNQALSKLSTKAILRRQKVFGDGDIIFYEDIPVNKLYINEIEKLGVKVENVLDWFNSISCYLTESEINKVKLLPFVKEIKPVNVYNFQKPIYENIDKPIESILTSNYTRDYGQSFKQNELSSIPLLHDFNITGKGIIIGVLDTGFEWRTHDALKNTKVIAEKDFVFGDNNTANEPGDDPAQSNHGTYCLSIIAGYKEGYLIGTAFDCSFILAKTEDIRSETRIEEDNYAAAIQWMENYGVDITTSSLGYNIFDNYAYSYSDMNGKTAICTKAVEEAYKRGVVTITSAGNEGNNNWRYITAPADGFNIISVGAVDYNNQIASFSSRGPTYDGRIKPEVTAMGVSVFGADTYSNGYRFASGTSSAAPIVAGIAGLLLSKFNYLTNEQVRNIILESGKNVKSPDNNIGYGLLDAFYALSFPNLRFENGRYILTKFLPGNISNVIFKYLDNDNYLSLEMSQSEQNIYQVNIPNFEPNKVVNFLISYTDENGQQKNIPENGTFKLKYGFLPIEFNRKIYEETIKVSTDGVFSYPNPFRDYINIDLNLSKSDKAEIYIYDIIGRKVKKLYNGFVSSGKNKFVWNGTDENNKKCSSGVYIVAVVTNGKLLSNKLIFVK